MVFMVKVKEKSLYFRDIYWNTYKQNDLSRICSKKTWDGKVGLQMIQNWPELIIVEDKWQVHDDSLH